MSTPSKNAILQAIKDANLILVQRYNFQGTNPEQTNSNEVFIGDESDLENSSLPTYVFQPDSLTRAEINFLWNNEGSCIVFATDTFGKFADIERVTYYAPQFENFEV